MVDNGRTHFVIIEALTGNCAIEAAGGGKKGETQKGRRGADSTAERNPNDFSSTAAARPEVEALPSSGSAITQENDFSLKSENRAAALFHDLFGILPDRESGSKIGDGHVNHEIRFAVSAGFAFQLSDFSRQTQIRCDCSAALLRGRRIVKI